jgi:mRNA interferase MazF
MYSTSITQKGQVTIPISIRKKLGLKTAQKVAFEEQGNVVVAGITSNLEMKGIPLLKKEGAIKESIIKLNYIFTISEKMIEKFLFKVSEEKKRIVKEELIKRIN